MKKLSIVALSLALLLTLVGCGGKSQDASTNTDAVETGAVSFTTDTVFDEGTVVTVETLTSGENFERAKAAIASISEQFTVYDFNATKDGEKVQPTGKLKVTFRIPDNYGENVCVYYIPETGAAEAIPTTVDKDAGTAVAELEHFSIYLLACEYYHPTSNPSSAATAAMTTQATTATTKAAATAAKATAKPTTAAATKAPTTAQKAAAPTTPKTNAVQTVNPSNYKDNYYYVADLQEVSGGLVRSRLYFTGEHCIVMRYGYSSDPEEGNYPYEYNGKTYYGVGEGQSPGSFKLTDTEILITIQNEGTVVIKTVLQSDGNMRVTYSTVEYFFVGQILKPQAE